MFMVGCRLHELQRAQQCRAHLGRDSNNFECFPQFLLQLASHSRIDAITQRRYLIRHYFENTKTEYQALQVSGRALLQCFGGCLLQGTLGLLFVWISDGPDGARLAQASRVCAVLRLTQTLTLALSESVASLSERSETLCDMSTPRGTF